MFSQEMMSLLKGVIPKWKTSWRTRKAKSTKNTRARKRKGGGRVKRRAALNRQNQRKNRHHQGLSGPPEPVPDLQQQQQELLTMLCPKGTAKRRFPQIVLMVTPKSKSTKDMQAKRKRKKERRMKSKRKSPHLILHLKAAQRQAPTLKKSLQQTWQQKLLRNLKIKSARISQNQCPK